MTEGRDARDEAGEKNWTRLYGAVLAFLALEIVLFYLLTRAFH